MKHVLYRGKQIQPSNAVFTNKRSNGIPKNICKSKTGEINGTAFSHSKKYAIALYLKDNCNTLKLKLHGKSHISVGNEAIFILNYAVLLMETQRKALVSNFQFSYYFGNHFRIFTPEYTKAGDQFLKKKLLKMACSK